MNVKIISHTNDPLKVIAAAAKTCYSKTLPDVAFENMTGVEASRFIKMLRTMGHMSPFEHVSFTFAVSGVSRSLLAQITRHRIASFSVTSQRYIDYTDNLDVTVPPLIENNSMAKFVFDTAIRESFEAYQKIHKILLFEQMRSRFGYRDIMKSIQDITTDEIWFMQAEELVAKADVDLQKMWKKELSASEKIANENARAVFPNATNCNYVMTMNVRELLHFFSLRCCNRAQDEIRDLAWAMFHCCYQICPEVFENAGPNCLTGACTEGKMCCGKQADVRERYHQECN